MDFIKDNLVRMPDTPEPGYEREHGNDRDSDLVVPLGTLLLWLVWLCLLESIRNIV